MISVAIFYKTTGEGLLVAENPPVCLYVVLVIP